MTQMGDQLTGILEDTINGLNNQSAQFEESIKKRNSMMDEAMAEALGNITNKRKGPLANLPPEYQLAINQLMVKLAQFPHLIVPTTKYVDQVMLKLNEAMTATMKEILDAFPTSETKNQPTNDQPTS